MKLVVDANVLFAVLIREGKTSELFFREDVECYAPDFLLEELKKYRLLIEAKSDLNVEVAILRVFSRITVVPIDEIDQAYSIISSPDPNDIPYLALAKHLNCSLWSNDKRLKEQKEVVVYTTQELMTII